MIKRTPGLKVRIIARNLFAFFIGCVFALLLLEIAIRLFPHKFIQYLDFYPTLSLQKDKDVGYVLTPHKKTINCKDCLRIYPIYTNSAGFRDNEWQSKAGFKIAILGDSYVLSREVSEGDYTAAILERVLDKEVLNSGASGWGTLTELLVYRKFLRPFRPNVIIIFFSLNNDVHDNSCELTKQLGYNVTHPCGYIRDGKIRVKTEFDYPETPDSQTPSMRIKRFIKKYCLSCKVINRFRFQKLYNITHRRLLRDRRLYYWDVYRSTGSKVWQEAWQITASALIDLKREIEHDGGQLLIVPLPEYIKISKTGLREFKRDTGLSKIPEDFNPLYPLKKLKEICVENNISFLDLGSSFIGYRDKFNLQYPYFSYWCDGHYNPLGYFLAANLIARYLIEHNWIPLSEKEKTELLKKIGKNLKFSPRKILGEEAYKQIYHHGVYLGSSNIGKIIKDYN